jgi:hypothetical protein
MENKKTFGLIEGIENERITKVCHIETKRAIKDFHPQSLSAGRQPTIF